MKVGPSQLKPSVGRTWCGVAMEPSGLAKVFLSASGTLAEEAEDSPPVAHVPWLGAYYFLLPGFVVLAERTGQVIDPQKDAFFHGKDLSALGDFVREWSSLANAQPESWSQLAGHEVPSREPVYMQTSRAEVLSFLGDLSNAVDAAKAADLGVLFWGE